MDYSQLSDFEINRMVGDIIFKGLGHVSRKRQGITPTNGITETLIQLLSH
ncbi:protein ninX [Salmonella enterica subsp. enterica]|uniref:Protein ninX n=1 Tax=Salmonella enterica I TaxID=59201 RepID=A0A379WCU2_SALET|nr:protein ninX [Salmonella enterica subsp. enterica]